jgi:hypothetical protein
MNNALLSTLLSFVIITIAKIQNETIFKTKIYVLKVEITQVFSHKLFNNENI